MTAKSTHISEGKRTVVGELSELFKKHKTVLIASIKNIPGSQFQEITKKLRGKTVVKVPKKNLVFKAIDSSKDAEIKKIEEKIDRDFALLFSNMDCFDLAMELIKNKSPSKAKAGQIAPFDIEIPAGPTDLVPGPAISELGALGIQIQIEGGKITIKNPKIVCKKDAKIPSNVADMMSKLNIKPFTIGFIPIAGFDNEKKIFYSEIDINPEKTLQDFKEAYGKALPFAVNIGYATPETITFLIGKAGMHEKAIEKITQTPELNSSSVEETN